MLFFLQIMNLEDVWMIFDDLIYTINNYIYVDPIILRIIFALLFIIFGFILSHIFVKYIIKLLIKFANKTKSNLDNLLINAMEKPARVLIVGLSIWTAINIFNPPALFQGFLIRVLRTFIIVIFFWFLYRAAHIITFIFERYLNKSGKKASPVLSSVFRKSLKFIIVLLEIFMIIREWGYDISGFIAGLGVGGLAFSLAAKDAASNLLGSAYFGHIRTLIPGTSGRCFGIIRTAFRLIRTPCRVN